MKNLKKILALVLAFACAFTMFAGAAFTDQSDIKVDSEVVDTLVSLGVVEGFEDGSFQPNGTVTRAQMAKMIYVLRTGNSDASAYNNDKTSFTDINGHWAAGYIKYCQSLGIIAGKSATIFAPNAQVTTQEAAKMLLVTLGYDANKAGLVGAGWAAKTNALADENGLLEDVNTSFTAACPRQYAAQLIYNTIFAPTVVLRDGEYTNMKLVTGANFDNYNPTVGEKYMKLLSKIGVLESVQEDNKGTFTLKTSNSGSFTKVKADYFDLLGQQVKVLYKDTDDVYGVFATDKNEFTLKTTIGMIDEVITADKKIKVDGTKYDYDSATLTKVLENYNSADNSVTIDKLAGDANYYDQSSTVYLVSNNEDEKIDTAIVIPSTVVKVTYVGSDSVTLGGTVGSVDTDDITLYDGIKKGDYVLYTADDASGLQKDSVEKVDVLTGKVSAIKDGTTVKVDGNWYKKAKTVSSAPAIDSTVEMAVYEGYYYSVDETAAATTADVLFVLEAGKISTGVATGVEATVLFTDGTKDTIVVSKVNNNGTEADATTVTSAADSVTQAYAANTVVVGRMYTFTKDGSKYKLENLADTAGKRAGFDLFVAGKAGSFDESEDSLNDGRRIADDAIVFVANSVAATVSNASTGAEGKVITGKQLKAWKSDWGTSVSYLAKKVNGVQTASVIALVDTATSYATDENTYGFITEDPEYIKVDGTSYVALTVWNGSENVTMYAKSYMNGTETTVTGASDAANGNFKKGNAILFERDGSEGDVPVIVKTAKVTETFAVTGIYNESSTKTDLTVTSTGVEMPNTILKMDEDTEVIYINTDKKTGISGGELQTATEAAIDDTYIKNIIAYTDGSFASGETAKVIFVDVANKLAGEYELSSTAALTAIQGATAKVTSFTNNQISLAATGTVTKASLTQATNAAAVSSADQYAIDGMAASFNFAGATAAIGDTITVVAADGTTTVYTFVA